MGDHLYSTVAFNPFPVQVSGQEIKTDGSNLDSLTATTITWELSNTSGVTPLGSDSTGAVRIALPIGPESAALLQNTVHRKLSANAATRMTSPDATIYVVYDVNAFNRAGLALETAISTDFCTYRSGGAACMDDPVCVLAAGSSQRYIILTVSTQSGATLPYHDMDDISVTLVNGFTSAQAGECTLQLLQYDVAEAGITNCPSDPVIGLPVTKVPLEPGVSSLRAEPCTQFVTDADMAEVVELKWAFSEGGMTDLQPTGTLWIGRQGEVATQVPLDSDALRRGSHPVTPNSGVTFVQLDYVLAGQGTGQPIGGREYVEFNVVAQRQSILNPVFSGTTHMLGTPVSGIASGSYMPDGDGYLLCVLYATGAPTADPPTPQSYIEVVQGDTKSVLAISLSITAAASVTVTAAMTQQTSQLVPLRGGTEVQINISDDTITCVWLPIGDASLAAI